MTYTFDEAIEELRLAIPKSFYSPTMHDIAVMLETQTKVINLLREEYAPTVEMTEEDKQSLLDLKSRATFYYFNQCVEKWQQNRIGLQISYGGLTEDDLMQAWLHPETIKVVDE